MNILFINNLGTILYTFFFGRKIGKDNIGNTYYISKSKRKWVIYKNKKDPTIIPVKWQIWLTSENENVNLDSFKHSWEKDRTENLTGTNRAYHPTKELNHSNTAVKKKYQKWDPNKDD